MRFSNKTEETERLGSCCMRRLSAASVLNSLNLRAKEGRPHSPAARCTPGERIFQRGGPETAPCTN